MTRIFGEFAFMNTVRERMRTDAPERRKRKRRGKLAAEQIGDGITYLRKHPDLKPKQAYPQLRRVLKCDVGDTTLWRVFFRK
jgi:hypothetical protein